MARNAQILVVSPEDREAVRAYWEREKLPFVGLADPDHYVASLYGQEVSLLKLGRLPELVVIDPDGEIRYLHHASWMSDIPGSSALLEVLDRLNRARAESPEKTEG